MLAKEGSPFVFTMPSAVLSELHYLDKQAAGNIAWKPLSESHTQKTYLIRSLIEEAITSSQLEGATTTRDKAKAMIREGRTPETLDERMIMNNYRAMRQILGHTEERLTPEYILALHKILTEGTLDNPQAVGRLRQSDSIGVYDERTNELLHDPPKFKELPERMEKLCHFANDYEPDYFLHPLVKAILLHFQLAYDHPFEDGNGRTARALFYWYAVKQGYWLMEYISISSEIKKAPVKYGEAFLCTETDENDTTYFILHQLDVIRKAINGLDEYITRRFHEYEEAERLLTGSVRVRGLFNHRQIDLVRDALKNPGKSYSFIGHGATHGVVHQTARTDLLGLEKAGLLVKRKEGSRIMFYAPAGLRERLGAL
ncbi:MAG: Fic family protein [Nitrospinae bacterium]|nr:Fic family protein [Nitrospinota bacterium]